MSGSLIRSSTTLGETPRDRFRFRDCVDGSGLATSVVAIYDGVTRLFSLSLPVSIDDEKERKAARVRNTR